jgi:hypothetical protein
MVPNQILMLDKHLTARRRAANGEDRSMWFHSDPDQRLLLAQVRQRELLDEARTARRSQTSRTMPARVERVRGLHLQVGRVLIVVGRTINDERPCPDLAA